MKDLVKEINTAIWPQPKVFSNSNKKQLALIIHSLKYQLNTNYQH